MTEQSAITDQEDRDLIRHALGLGASLRPYRKHFTAPTVGPTWQRCVRLETAGLLVRFGEPDGVGQTFHVTQKGAAMVGEKLP